MLQIISRYICYIMLVSIINIYAAIIDLDSIDQLRTEISNHTTPVLLVFGAEWCGACQTIKKPLEEVLYESEFANVTAINIDINKFPELVHEFNIAAIPTLKYFIRGKEVNSTMGAIDPTTYKDDMRKGLRTTFNNDIQKQHDTKKEEKNIEINNQKYTSSEMKNEEKEMEDVETQSKEYSQENGFFAETLNTIAEFFTNMMNGIKSIFGY